MLAPDATRRKCRLVGLVRAIADALDLRLARPDNQISFSNADQDREIDCILLHEIDNVGTNEVVVEKNEGLLSSFVSMCAGRDQQAADAGHHHHQDIEDDEESEALCLMIKTSPESQHLGRVYTYRAESREAFVRWKQLLNDGIHRAKQKIEEDLWQTRYPTPFTRFRARVGAVYDSPPAQYLLTLVVLFSYATDIAETEFWPEEGTNLAWLFDQMDFWTSITFTFELAVNLFANSEQCFRPFFSDPWNVVDFVVVGATLHLFQCTTTLCTAATVP